MDPTNTTSEPVSESSQKPKPSVVGVGASAGGLAALKTFFDHIPASSGLAFVVVVHLSPEHESHLADLLQPHVGLPVQQVWETTPIEPDHVYVIPPGRNLSTIDTHLRVSTLEERRRERAPIDHFFRTLAKTHDGHAVGVILTGTGSDGTLGVKDIKAKGGIIIVQDPNEAQFDGMPQSAIATGIVDLILPVAEIPAAILKLAQTQPQVPGLEDGEGVEAEQRTLLHKVFAQLRARTGRDFGRYKQSTILRRIARRMQINYIEQLPEYLQKLREQPEEVRTLADDLLITVTSFFRDTEVFTKLERDIIPRLFENKKPDSELRVWSVGCATGEEAYSLAILLLEHASSLEVIPRIQVFASDLHEHSLVKAREGFYPGDIDTDVSPERLKRFFLKENGGYRVRKEVRELVVFTPHNLLGDPPFSRLDFVSCRNLLIYLQRDVQRDIVELFHYALRPDGYLVLGTSEIIEAADLFRNEDKNLRIYRKRNVPSIEPRLPVFPLTRTRFAEAIPESHRREEVISYGSVHQRMVELYAPPSLLVSPDDKVAHFSEHVGRYIVHPGGQPTLNVFKLIREELAVELRAALHAAREAREPVRSNPVPVRFNGHARPVSIHVRPALEAAYEGFVLVIFDEREPEAAAEPADISDPAHALGKREGELESELQLSRQRLQGLIEEYETSREEMKASNEELQSMNEELRSTMEELETSKEELQSMNEELQTVNQENRHKVEELAQLSSDLQNLLVATDIATLFLDRELRILRFTPKVAELFNVRMTDRGRPLSDLTHRLGYGGLQADATSVLRRLAPIEREVQDDNGRWYFTRVLPYRSGEDRIEGIVITFIDISIRKQAEENLSQSEERYRLLVESAKEYAMVMLDPEGHIKTWSPGAQRIFGYSESEAIGKSGELLFTPEDRAAGVPGQEMEVAAREEKASDERWQLRKNGSRFWASGVMEALRATDGGVLCYVKVLRDSTEQKHAEEGRLRTQSKLEELVKEQTREVRARESQVRDLAARLTVAEHEERHRIAHILHDDLQQLLYSVQLKLALLRSSIEHNKPGDLRQNITQMEEWVSEAVRTTQHLAVDLSPQVLESEGLTEALQWLAGQMKELHGIDIRLKAPEKLQLERPIRVLLFQAVRELLFNVVKHSGVHEAEVNLSMDGQIVAKVSDRGRGFDVHMLESHAGFGVLSVKHRLTLLGGSMKVDSAPGRGTTVTILAPLESSEEA